MRKIILAVITTLAAATPYISAQAAAFQPNFTVVSDEIVYNVNADGTYTKDESERFRINTDQGVKQAGQIPLYYSTSLQDLSVVEAYTTTKDGKRIDVPSDAIREQQSRESADAPMFDDGKVKTVVFPGVEVGATVTLHERKTQRKPIFPGQFSLIEHFSDQREFRSATVTVRAPASLKLNVNATGMTSRQADSDTPDIQVWRWSLENAPAHAPELDSVGAADHSPYVAVTTFPNFAAVGTAYLARAEPKAAVTPAVQTLANQITKGITDPKAQAEVLYDWVSTHIRYVAIYLDFGGVVPHDADTILKAEYGDCKDHVTILQALLAAKGIKSSPVLVNAGNIYSLPGVAAPLGVFDHAITYLPDFKLFADSTAGVARFGTLPITELGKPALVADDGSGIAKMVTLPLGTADNTREQTTIRLTLDSDGNVKGTGEINSIGTLEWLSREIFASLQPGVEPQVASRVLTLTGQNGTGNYQHGDVHDLARPFVYRTDFQLPGYAQLPGPGAIQVPIGLSSFSNIESAFQAFGPETRDFAMPFLGRHLTETTIITLPDGVTVSNLPKPVKIVSPFGTYTSSYVVDGRSITVTRDLAISMQSALVQPDQYPELRKMALAVMRDFHTQLIY
jgi:transglutaminase-like putative cysteine protease